MVKFHFNLSTCRLLHFCEQALNTLSPALFHDCTLTLFLLETKVLGKIHADINSHTSVQETHAKLSDSFLWIAPIIRIYTFDCLWPRSYTPSVCLKLVTVKICGR